MKTSNQIPSQGRTLLAKKLRKKMSPAETILWSTLRNRKLGVKFRRQIPIGNYIVDFLSIEIKLIIEVDGSQHGTPSTIEKDKKRDEWLRKQGYSILRIWVKDLFSDRDKTMRLIGDIIKDKLICPSP